MNSKIVCIATLVLAGVRGYMSAYDTETGEFAWRFFIVKNLSNMSHTWPLGTRLY